MRGTIVGNRGPQTEPALTFYAFTYLKNKCKPSYSQRK